MITYYEYIDFVLYDPQYGYYMRDKEKIGTKGDFITSSNYSDILGKMIAKWFINQTKEYSLPPVFCELGAGNGRFAKAFMEEWYRCCQQRELTYIIIEKSPYHIRLQKEQFDKDWNVKYVDHVKDLEMFKGMLFSNELFDAFPVHVIEKNQGVLNEIMVAIEDKHLVEKVVPLSNNAIANFIKEYKINLVEGQRIEISLDMETMISNISSVLNDGFLVTIDYGYSNEEWQESIRREGSLRGYYQHKLVKNVLKHPGEMDITSHIHWDVLEGIGERYNLKKINRWKQYEFLIDIGILEELENHSDHNPFSETNKRNRAIRSLVMPQGISDSFHVLVQKKT
ncbi:SAM-dependent methyltransferase [Niallia sp. XMNu-256]|uniref:SAM-dependent methyltransferase n=1 Tax=Niallia sp. XMNu-256 TaxID=3082444 RepID=UPI0030D4ACAB